MTDAHPDRPQAEDDRRRNDADEDAPPREDIPLGRPTKQKRCGTPRILSDTEDHFTFTIPRSGLASNEAIRFEKAGNESWIETVKWAQRNGKRLCVRYEEREASVFWIEDEPFLVYPPTDLFESS
jgi:hypothetical protein